MRPSRLDEPQTKIPRRSRPARNHGALPSHLPRYEVVIDVAHEACPCCGGEHALHRRIAHRAARYRTGAIARAGDASPALRLPQLRGSRGGRRGAGTADRWRHADRGADRACRGQQVLRFPAAVSAVADAGAPGHHAGSLDAEQLGWQRLLVADTALRSGGRHCAVVAKIFADDTTLPVLDPGRGRTKTGYLWCYAVDDRPWCGPSHPAVAYIYSEDRKNCAPRRTPAQLQWRAAGGRI